jgi:hypothetical protein
MKIAAQFSERPEAGNSFFQPAAQLGKQYLVSHQEFPEVVAVTRTRTDAVADLDGVPTCERNRQRAAEAAVALQVPKWIAANGLAPAGKIVGV